MKFYRYEDRVSLGDPYLIVYYLISETPSGYWISENPNYDNEQLIHFERDQKHWISKTSRKRRAYPTKKEAAFNYLCRKVRAIEILEARLEKQKFMLEIAREMNKTILADESVDCC